MIRQTNFKAYKTILLAQKRAFFNEENIIPLGIIYDNIDRLF